MIDPSIRLRRAIHLKDVPLVRRILKANPALVKNPDYDDKSNTSLHIAAKAGMTEIVELLLDAHHEDTEISLNADSETPLMLSASAGQVEVSRLLITRYPRCIPWRNKRGVDVLSLSSQTPASTPLIPLLLTHPTYPACVSSTDNEGNTALHHASAAGSLLALRMLLHAGADPNARNTGDWTPLAYSQTVAAEVYFKGLIAEVEKGGNLFPEEGEDDGVVERKRSDSFGRTIRSNSGGVVPVTGSGGGGGGSGGFVAANTAQGKPTGQRRRPAGGGVRLITNDGNGFGEDRPTLEEMEGTFGTAPRSPAYNRRAMTPTVSRSVGSWAGSGEPGFLGLRGRAASGE